MTESIAILSKRTDKFNEVGLLQLLGNLEML